MREVGQGMERRGGTDAMSSRDISLSCSAQPAVCCGPDNIERRILD